MNKKGLRKGFTTGTCAAAASNAAAAAFLTKKKIKEVEVTLPTGKSVILPVHRCEIEKDKAIASVIKDAGDDPDVTNGAEIIAEVFTLAKSKVKSMPLKVLIKGQISKVRWKKSFYISQS